MSILSRKHDSFQEGNKNNHKKLKSKSFFKGGWKTDLVKIINEKGKYSYDGHKVVSYATRQARKEALFSIFNDIRNTLGFKIQNIRNITGKHVEALVKLYEERYKNGEIAAATIKNRLSHLNTFSKWIDKIGLVKPLEKYNLSIPIIVQKMAEEPKSWAYKKINALEKIEAIRHDQEINVNIRNRICDALLLQFHFGLRSKESLLFKPSIDDRDTVLCIVNGTKGGKNRFVPLRTTTQRQLLDRIKNYIPVNESMVPHDKTYECFRRTYYNVLKKHGITRENGITAHGLRHEYINNLFEEVTNKILEQKPEINIQSKIQKMYLNKAVRKVTGQDAGHTYNSGFSYAGKKTLDNVLEKRQKNQAPHLEKHNIGISNNISQFDEEKLEAIRHDYEVPEAIRNRICDVMLLQLYFDLSSEESLLLKPSIDYKEGALCIANGTKDGENRLIPVLTEKQRQFLERVKSYIPDNESMVPDYINYEYFINSYYNTLKKYGINTNYSISP